MGRPVYLDAHATTPVDPRVLEAMLPFFSERFGNAASRTHAFGWEAARAVERARQQVAQLLGVTAGEIVFTSGATEANNLAIKGAARAAHDRGDHIVTVVTEHSSVLEPCRRLEREGFRVTWLPVERDGLVDLERLEAALTERTILVSVMAANNEIGVLQPIEEIARIAARRGVLVHTDAAQAVGHVPAPLGAWGVDLASISAHKMYGPKGIGALYLRRRRPPVAIEPLADGGGHERGLRPGTLDVPAIVGFGRAAEIAREEGATHAARLARLRDRLLEGLLASLDGVIVNGSLERRLPHNLNVSFEGVEGEQLLLSLGDLAVAPGAACASATTAPSHVLKALGHTDELARASLRIGLGRYNSDEDVDYVLERLRTVVPKLRAMRTAGAGT
ncbi:MAG TPA: aminotransferase class V-fold PLP-dependent enzyme [Vicinamibacterales bacterium]|nr:aminotransferase class V-fold PLP-dependent enzyme [Vicinamibacterales bacterium]